MRESHHRFIPVCDRKWFLGLLSNTEFRDADMQVSEMIGAWPAATERSGIGLRVNVSIIVAWTETAASFTGPIAVQPSIAAPAEIDDEEVFEAFRVSKLVGQIPAPIDDADQKMIRSNRLAHRCVSSRDRSA
jgi:hypothetical protein